MSTQRANIRLTATDQASGALRGVQGSTKKLSDTVKSAASSMSVFQGEADKLRAKLIPSFAETQKFKSAVYEADQALKLGAISATEYAQVIARLKTEHQSAMAKIEGSTKSAAASMSVFGTEMDRLKAKYNPQFASLQKFRKEFTDLRRAQRMGVITHQEYRQQLNLLRQSSGRVASSVTPVTNAIQRQNTAIAAAPAVSRSWNRGLTENRRAVQQLGFQMTDFGVQIAGGQNAMLAFVQQGGQMLQVFGPMGAIAAAMVTVFGTLAIVMGKTGKSLADITPIMGVVEDQLNLVVAAAQWLGNMFADVANLVVNNLDVIIISATALGTYMAVRWVASWTTAMVTTGAFSNVLRATAVSYQMAGAGAAAATLATSAFSTALGVLRTAMLRLGLPALIIAVSWVAVRLIEVSDAIGGLVPMLKMFVAIVRETMTSAGNYIGALALRAKAWFADLGASMIEAVAGFTDWLSGTWANNVVSVYAGAYAAIIETWSALPEAFIRLAKQAINGLVDILGKGLDFVVEGVNKVRRLAGMDDLPPLDLSGWKLEVGETVDVAGRAAAAFQEAFGKDYLSGMTTGLQEASGAMRETAGSARANAAIMAEAARQPIESWQQFLDLWNKTKEAGRDVDVRDWFGGAAAEGAAGGAGRGAVDELNKGMKELEKTSFNLNESLAGAFTDALTGVKSLTEGVKDLLKNMAQMFLNEAFMRVLGNMFPGFNSISFGGARAMGGHVAAGKSYMVGERGPERFTPGAAGVITPNHKLGDGGTVVQVINNSGQPSRQERGTMPDGREFVRTIIGEEASSGGLDKSLGNRFGVSPSKLQR